MSNLNSDPLLDLEALFLPAGLSTAASERSITAMSVGHPNSQQQTKKQYKRKLTSDRQIQNRVHQKALRDRRSNQLKECQAELEEAKTKLETQAQRIQELEAENNRLVSPGNAFGAFRLDSGTTASRSLERCQSCVKLEQRNKFLESQLSYFHSYHHQLFVQSQTNQGKLDSPLEGSSPLATSIASSSQDDLIPSSESLYGRPNLEPYRHQIANLPNIGIENANVFMDIVEQLSKCTTKREIRRQMMIYVTVKCQLLDKCGILERAHLLEILYQGNHEPANEPHVLYFARNMGRPELQMPSPLSAMQQERRANILKQFEPCVESLRAISSLQAVPHLIEQLVAEFVDRIVTTDAIEYETRFVAFNETYSALQQYCDAASSEDRRNLLLTVEVMRSTEKSIRSRER
ncbi:UNVERIFIED_CONTAM: hypothetical protein HDU68_005986 [Siphonaria sp. JEL0065]|nr:hypothetical protein HDU68_005986 [Siphonaria sp. JEL0065]